MRIADIAHEDCILWLWTTNADLLSGDALRVLEAWQFTPKTMLTWVKDRFGTGDWLRGQSEQCIMAVRGAPTVTLTNQTTVLCAPASPPYRTHRERVGSPLEKLASELPTRKSGHPGRRQRQPHTGPRATNTAAGCCNWTTATANIILITVIENWCR